MKLDWAEKPLGQVCEYTNGTAHEQYIDDNGRYKVINSKFISSDGTNYKRSNKGLSILSKGDIALVLSDVPNGKTLAKCFLVDKDETYTLNQRVCRIRSDKFDPKFLYYQINRHSYFLAFDNGENQTNLRLNQVLQCPLLIPPLTEQQRIVAILDEAFESIAIAKANAEKNLQNAKALFESYLQGVFSQGGEGWQQKTLEEIATTFGRGKSRHRPRNEPSLYGGKYPFIQTGDIRNAGHLITEFSQTYSEAGLAQSKLWPKGTICITIAANIAETAILGFDACFPDSVIGVVANPKEADIDYVEYLLQSFKARIQSLGKGSAQANINMGTFENERFPFPSVTEQKQIVIKLNSLSEETQRLESLYQQKITALDELKKALLHQAFSGQL